MPEFRRYPKGTTRQIIDFQRLLAKLATGECDILCVPVALTDIIRYLLKDRGLWRTTYAIGYSETGYTIPTQEEFTPIAQVIYTFLEDTNIMGCTFEELANAVTYLADKLAAKTCCGSGAVAECGPGTGGAGSTEALATEAGDDGYTVPDGFTDYAEYIAYKCDVATYLITTWEADVATMSTVNLVGLTVSALAIGLGAAMLSVIPGGLLVAISATLLLMVSAGSTLEKMQDAFTNSFDELVCALWSAEDVAGAKQNLLSAFETALASETTDVVLNLEGNNLFSLMVSNDALNRLFEKWTFMTLPTGNCDTCVKPDDLVVEYYNSSLQYVDLSFTYDKETGIVNFTVPHADWGDGYPGTRFRMTRASEDNFGYSIVIDSDEFVGTAGPVPNEVYYTPVGGSQAGPYQAADENDLNGIFSALGHLHTYNIRSTNTGTCEYTITVTWETS